MERYPLPRVEELFLQLRGGKHFTKLDLANAYLQVEVDEKSREYLTISTHKGLFQYTRLPFGISSGPSIFQKLMEGILQGIEGVIVFLDDVLITGATQEQHLERLDKVLKILQDSGLKISRSKCEFFKNTITYLGYKIDSKGLHSDSSKIEAIVNVARPTNVSELRAFLGMVNYYHKFIPNCADILKPLYSLLQINQPFIWSKICAIAFEKIKKILTSLEVLVHFDPNLDIKLTTDASAVGIGAVISHILPNGQERPIAYASRTLNNSETKYSQIEREALSIIFGVNKFYQYLFAKTFILATDHKPLVTIFSPSKGIPQMSTNRLQRWALFLSNFSYKVQYVPSKQNCADGLSRLPLRITTKVNSENSFLNYVESSDLINWKFIKEYTSSDSTLGKVIRYVKNGWPKRVEDSLKPYFRESTKLHIVDDCLLHGYRVVIPKSMQQTVLNELHVSHMGIVKTKSLARSYVWWPTMNLDIENVIKSCNSCLILRDEPNKAILEPWKWPNEPWYRIHIDYCGPIKGKMFLVVLDAHSKWLEVFATSSTTTEATIQILYSLFARFGLPHVIVSDNAAQFTSAEFKDFAERNGIILKTGAPFHPATNGAAENAVKTVKKAIMRGMNDGNLNLYHVLARFLLNYRNTPHCTTGKSPAELFIGRKLRMRLDLIKPISKARNNSNISKKVLQKQRIQKFYYKGNRQNTFNIGDTVAVRDYRIVNKPGWIKAEIIKQNGTRTYLVKILELNDVIWKRHINQMVKVNSILDYNIPNVVNTNPAIPEIRRHSLNITNTKLRPKCNIKPPERLGINLSEEV